MNINEYVKKDISEKKVLLDAYPKNTDARKEKFIKIVTEIEGKYTNIEKQMENFINYKYDKLLPVDNEKSINELIEKKNKLLKLFKYFNKDNSYYEKTEIDIILYKLTEYYNNTIPENDKLIRELLDYFSSFKVNVTEEDFKDNIYEYYYMKMFYDKEIDLKKLEEEHLKVYWKYPKVFEAIIISINKILYLNEKNLEEYSNTKRRSELVKYKISSIDDLKKIYKSNYSAIEKNTTFYESDIINNCLDGELDYTTLSFTKEALEEIFNKILINKVDLTNQEETNKAVLNIIKLKRTLEEYKTFKANEELFKYFETTYKEHVNNKENIKDIKQLTKDYNKKKQEIIKKVKNITKLKNITKVDSIDQELDTVNTQLLTKQMKELESIYNEFKELDKLYYDIEIKKIINDNTSSTDILYFLITYPNNGLHVVSNVFKLEKKEEVLDKYNDLVELYYNPNRKVYDMYYLFIKNNIEQELMNGFRFENINITEESFQDTKLNELINDCNTLLLKVKASNFERTFDEIEFLVQTNGLKKANDF